VDGSWLVVASVSILTLLVYLVGVYLVWMPRQCAVLAEVFAASGNFPSLIPRSVRAAVFEMRAVGVMLLAFVLFLLSHLLTPQWSRAVFHTSAGIANPNWLVFPAMLAVLAGDVVMFDLARWVARTLDFWVDHPLVPRQMIPAFHWAVRIAGVAIFLFGAGIFWVWLAALTA
jgi:hypothetical protein